MRGDPQTIDRTKEKRCSRCRAIKPLDSFNKHRAHSDGHAYICRACLATQYREAVDRVSQGLPPRPKREPVTWDPMTEKRCPRCRTVKPLTAFSKNRNARNGHRPYCKPCDRDMKREARVRERTAKGLPPRFDPSIDRTREKRCSRCRAVKPLAEFARGGRQCYCRDCRVTRYREGVDRRRATCGLPPRQWAPVSLDSTTDKWCPRCGQVKPLSAFHRHRNRPSGRRSYCKPCRSADDRARYARKHPLRKDTIPDGPLRPGKDDASCHPERM